MGKKPFDAARWAGTFRDHILKQLSVRAQARVEMAGLRAEVRLVGESWLWTVVDAETEAAGTALASGCESTGQEAARLAAKSLAAEVAKGDAR